MNNLRKFTTQADYSAATLNYPAVSWVVSEDIVHYDKTEPAPPTFSGLTVYYNISDLSQETVLFKYGGGSGSGSGSGGVMPSAMVIDGTEVPANPTYQFDTVGEHIVQYSFADNQIPEHFLDDESTGRFSTVTKVEISDSITSIGTYAFTNCYSLTSIDIPDSVTSIGASAFKDCGSLTSVTIGSGITSIGSDAFYSTMLNSLMISATYPPQIEYSTFSNISFSGTLTVPSGSQEYCNWTMNGYLSSGWTIEGVTCE